MPSKSGSSQPVTNEYDTTIKDSESGVIKGSDVKEYRPGTKDDPFRVYRISKQVMIISAWVSIGLYAGVIGPTLPDLRDSLGVGTDDISTALVGKSIGFVTGALIGGFLFRIFYKQADLLIFLSIAGMASIAFAPWGDSLAYVVFFFWLAGTSEGILNVGGNTMVMHLWGEYASTPLLLTHFGFGVGSVIAPQIARPFISGGDEDTDINTTTSSPVNDPSKWHHWPILMASDIDTYAEDYDMRFAYSYVVVAIFILAIACGFLYFVIRGPPKDYEIWKPDGDTKRMLNPGSCANGHWLYSIELLTCLFAYYMHLDGSQSSFSDFLYTFATESELNFSEDEASLITSVFWLFYTLGRLFGGVLAHWINVSILIGGAITISAVSMITMALFALDNEIVFWVFTCLYGLCITVLFPAGMGWSNIYLRMNSMSTMVLLMGSGLGKVPYQYTAGLLFEEKGPEYILYVSSFCISVMLLVFIIMQTLAVCQHGRVFDEDNLDETIVIDSKEEHYESPKVAESQAHMSTHL